MSFQEQFLLFFRGNYSLKSGNPWWWSGSYMWCQGFWRRVAIISATCKCLSSCTIFLLFLLLFSCLLFFDNKLFLFENVPHNWCNNSRVKNNSCRIFANKPMVKFKGLRMWCYLVLKVPRITQVTPIVLWDHSRAIYSILGVMLCWRPSQGYLYARHVS